MNSLSELDKWRLLELLGLASFGFLYEERLGLQVIRSWFCSEQGIEALFPASERTPSPVPALVRTHSVPYLSEVASFKAQSLWAECMPFPFSAWAEPSGAEASGQVSSTDKDWWAATQQLRLSFQALENKIFSCEMTHLHFEPLVGGAGMSLSFHCVRRKYLEIKSIDAREAESLGGTPVASRYQSLRLSIAQKGDLVSQVESLCSAIQTTVETGVESSLIGDNRSPLSPLPL